MSIRGGVDDDERDRWRALRVDGVHGRGVRPGASATAGSALLQQLNADAFGNEFTGLETWSDTTWWLLGRLVAGLRIGPDRRLGDLACGLGEPGLWLARATGADLVGVDWSPVAVAEASSRAGGFVPPGRARFAVGTLQATGLDDGELDAAVCLDAIFFAPDRIAALREVRRVLRPGGRFLFTADERARPELPHPVPDWTPVGRGGGFGRGGQGDRAWVRVPLEASVRPLARAPRPDPGDARRAQRSHDGAGGLPRSDPRWTSGPASLITCRHD